MSKLCFIGWVTRIPKINLANHVHLVPSHLHMANKCQAGANDPCSKSKQPEVTAMWKPLEGETAKKRGENNHPSTICAPKIQSFSDSDVF
eukprot:s2372_g5.t1